MAARWAESGSVAFMFARVGQILYPAKAASADTMLEAVIDAGGDNVESGAEQHDVTTSIDDFGAVRDALEKSFGEPESAKLTWKGASADRHHRRTRAGPAQTDRCARR